MLPKYSYLRQEIIRRRNERGWSQAQLASKAGVSQSLISKLERGDRIPNYERLRAIWNALSEPSSDTETVGEYMCTTIAAIAPRDTISTAAQLMHEHDYSQLPVKKDGHYVGIVFSWDILGKVADHPTSAVSGVMKRGLPTVPYDAPRSWAVMLLQDGCHAVLVTKEGEVVGIVTSHDFLTTPR